MSNSPGETTYTTTIGQATSDSSSEMSEMGLDLKSTLPSALQWEFIKYLRSIMILEELLLVKYKSLLVIKTAPFIMKSLMKIKKLLRKFLLISFTASGTSNTQSQIIDYYILTWPHSYFGKLRSDFFLPFQNLIINYLHSYQIILKINKITN